MTSFKIDHLPFTDESIEALTGLGPRYSNWPIVYMLDDGVGAYVGESRNAVVRLRQHRASVTKSTLTLMRLIIDETFNKSVCLDLESHLIRLLAGDGKYEILNGNDGITDANYFDREHYRRKFRDIFDELLAQGAFTRPVPEIENSDLFKLSPFKALTSEQAIAVEAILEGLFNDLESRVPSMTVIQGDPGTGKTIVAIYLMKLLRDIAAGAPADVADDSMFSDFFVEGYGEQLSGSKLGLVVPQQSLRESIKKVFAKTPRLSASMVLTPFQVGESADKFDLLVVDEAHRLNQRANQPSGVQNAKFTAINERLFGSDDLTKTQLDWIRAQSRHQILLLDSAQSVRPADLPHEMQRRIAQESRRDGRFHLLHSQMRVRAGADYVSYIRQVLSPNPPVPQSFGSYELLMFDDLGQMHDEIRRRDDEVGLARLVAGYAWPWYSKNDPNAFDIELDGRKLRWNRASVDWINSPGAIDEVGSIHTVQGYDLNYAGVIIGPELRYNAERGGLWFDRTWYYDKKGMENNPKLGLTYSDEDLLKFVRNIYGVLLTRGMLGTFVYVCDPSLKTHLHHSLGDETAG